MKPKKPEMLPLKPTYGWARLIQVFPTVYRFRVGGKKGDFINQASVLVSKSLWRRQQAELKALREFAARARDLRERRG